MFAITSKGVQLISGQPIKSFLEPRETSYPIVIIKAIERASNTTNIAVLAKDELQFCFKYNIKFSLAFVYSEYQCLPMQSSPVLTSANQYNTVVFYQNECCISQPV